MNQFRFHLPLEETRPRMNIAIFRKPFRISLPELLTVILKGLGIAEAVDFF